MKIGEVCRCIKEFHSTVPGELSLYKDDLVQIYEVIDKIWLKGEACGMIGKFPSSCVMKTELPDHPEDLPLFAVSADFQATHPGDLALKRGCFVVGLNSIDDAWWSGECCGRRGLFPANFVWKINKTLILDGLKTEREVSLYGKAISDVRAQLPEELSLRVGDFVRITHIIDEHWYRGECLGKTGIFPINFIEVFEEFNVPHKTNENCNNSKVEDEEYNMLLEPTSSLLNVESTTAFCSEPDNFALDNAFLNDNYFATNLSDTSTIENDFFQCDKQLSNLNEPSLNVDENLVVLDSESLSKKIDEYVASQEEKGLMNSSFTDDMDYDVRMKYTEDNTGIHPYGRAIFSFSAEYENELSFKKGDIIHLLNHVDSHWTVGKLSNVTGIFPTSYIDIIIDCPFKEEQCFSYRPKQAMHKPLGFAQVTYDFSAIKPGDISVKKGEVVSITNFIDENWVNVQKKNGVRGVCPKNYLTLWSEKDESSIPPSVGPPSPHTQKYSLEKDEFISEVQDADSRFDKNLDVKYTICQNNQENCPTTDNQMDILVSSLDKLSLDISEDVYSQSSKIKKIESEENPCEPAKLHKTTSNELEIKSTVGKSQSVDFPEDIPTAPLSESSSQQEPKLDPLRPPPPPPPISGFETSDEVYYSLPPTIVDDAADSNETEETNPDKVESLPESDQFSQIKRERLRRELVNELVTTEHEYIHDIDSLVHVVHLGKGRKEASAVDLKTLMGNISDVISLAKKFLRKLHAVSYEEEETLLIGPVFLELTDEMCEVYKIYCSNHSISVEPALKKYGEGGEALQFLQWVLAELQQHKIDLMDMRAVLIKPVQRILKYPLFIDRLLDSTSHCHADFSHLQNAKVKMLNIAKEINEYTNRLTLVSKYRNYNNPSFGQMIQKVSIRSVAKKGSRLKSRISATMGLLNQTKDLDFEEEEAKFHNMLQAANVILIKGNKLLHCVEVRQRSELEIAESIAAVFLPGINRPHLEAVRDATRDAMSRVFVIFKNFIDQHVLLPMKELLEMCEAPKRLIQKRNDKLLDYDTAQHRLDKNRDPLRTRILEEELNQAKSDYFALNVQLLTELPILSREAVCAITLAMKSVISAKMNMQGNIAKSYFNLVQIPELSYNNEEDIVTYFNSKYLTLLKSLSDTSFIPADHLPKSPKEKRRTLRKSLEGKRKRSSEKSVKRNVLELYSPHHIYEVTTPHKGSGDQELILGVGDLVAVIKMKDPTGCSDRWFVDDGETKGLVSSSCLQPYKRQPLTTNIPSTSSQKNSVITSEDSKKNSVITSEDSSVSGISSSSIEVTPQAMALDIDGPPRYETLFPDGNSVFTDDFHIADNIDDYNYENIYEEIGPPEIKSKESHCSRHYDEVADDVDSVQKSETEEIKPQFYYALYNFGGSEDSQLSLYEGQTVLALITEGHRWWLVEDRQGRQGYVPASYLSKYS